MWVIGVKNVNLLKNQIIDNQIFNIINRGKNGNAGPLQKAVFFTTVNLEQNTIRVKMLILNMLLVVFGRARLNKYRHPEAPVVRHQLILYYHRQLSIYDDISGKNNKATG
jgi:hypothetical protein